MVACAIWPWAIWRWSERQRWNANTCSRWHLISLSHSGCWCPPDPGWRWPNCTLGISTYEMLGAVARADHHQNWNAQALEIEEPLLNRQQFPYGCAYREYLTDDARLVTGNAAGGGVAGCRGLQPCGGDCSEANNPITPDSTVGMRSLARCFQCRPVLSSTPRVPGLEQLVAGDVKKPARLHLSKGVHLGLRRSRLPVRNMVMLTADDRRPVFAIARGSVTYIGTTDTTRKAPQDCGRKWLQRDVDYLLRPLQRYFPEAKIDPAGHSQCLGWTATAGQPARSSPEGDVTKRRDLAGWSDRHHCRRQADRLPQDGRTGHGCGWRNPAPAGNPG